MNFGIGIPTSLTLNDEKLPKRNECKYIGVYFDENLHFHDQIRHIAKKLNQSIVMIHKVCENYPIKCLLKFYNSFAKSIVCYEILRYGSTAKDHRYKIENAQQRIQRAMFSEITLIVLVIYLIGANYDCIRNTPNGAFYRNF